MIYLQLFLSYLQIGAFSFGGGYAAMPLIQAQVVEKYHWLSMTEFGDLVTIAEMTPGPIAINSAPSSAHRSPDFRGTHRNTRMYSAILHHRYSTCKNLYPIPQCKNHAGYSRHTPPGCRLYDCCGRTRNPKLGILSFRKFAPALSNFNIRGIIFFAGALLCLRKTKLSPILIMVGCGILELLYQTIF